MHMAAPARYELEVEITSATDLKNVNWRHGQLKLYAVVWVEPQTKCATTCADVSGGGGTYRWDQKLLIPFSTPIVGSTLHIDVIHAEGTRLLIGSAQIALCRRAERTLQLKRPSSRPQGKLEVEFSVRALVETRRGSGSGVDAVAGDFSGILLSDDDDEFFGEEDDDDDFGNDYDGVEEW